MRGPGASIRGAKAKFWGANFENLLSLHCRLNKIAFEKIPSGCKWVGKMAVPQKTPFDFIAAKNGRAVVFDAKTLDRETFPKSSCEPHQVEALHSFEMSKLTAGYIVFFRPINSVVFFTASQLKGLLPRYSLKATDGISLGTGSELNLGVLFDE
jgi:penicillin-binding protein-related factor A (putative recombinase)